MPERTETSHEQTVPIDDADGRLDTVPIETGTDRRVFLARLAQTAVGTAVAACLPNSSYGQVPRPPGNVKVGTSSTLATFVFQSPGWATFGLALPQGGATGGVQVGSIPTQTDVKTRWSDGSIRYAVVTAKIFTAGSYAITSASASTGSYSPAWPSASVAFTIGGTVWTATLPAWTSASPWLSAGSLVREDRVVVKPYNGAVPHPFLEVYFDVRSYSGGGHRVDVSVRNCLNVAAANSVSYDVAITLSGSRVYTRTGLAHYFMQLWRMPFTLGLTEAFVVPDFTPFYASNAIPEYRPDMSSATRTATFDPLNVSPMAGGWDDGGGRPDLYFYPAWTTEYIAHKTAAERAYMLNIANLSAGAWSIHLHEPTGLMIDQNTRPNFTLYGRPTDGVNGPANGFVGAHPTWQGENGGAHSPSIGYVEYLITGDRYFLDINKYRANRELISSARPLSTYLINQQIRGIGWMFRILAETASVVPDADPEKSYFVNWVTTAQRWLDTHAASSYPPSIWLSGLLFVGNYPIQVKGWMQTYCLFGIWRARRLGFNGGGTSTERRLRDYLLSLFTSGAAFDRTYAPSYTMIPYHHDGTKFSSLAEQFSFNFVSDNGEWAAEKAGDPADYPVFGKPDGHYLIDMRFALLLAKANGCAGAAEALTWLENYQGYPSSSYPSGILAEARTNSTFGHQQYLKEFSDSGIGMG
jgi:hypothetical protein